MSYFNCENGELCEDGFVCDDDSYGHCEERFPTVYWVFQFVFIGLFILQCLWAGIYCNKQTNDKSQQSAQPIPPETPQPATPQPQPETVTLQTTENNKNQLPAEWVECYTNDGRVYYQNNITKHTEWEKPEMSSPPNDQSLPDGWVQIYASDGKVYYQNNTTKQTQWEKPVIVPVVTTVVKTVPPTPPPPVSAHNNANNANNANYNECNYAPFLEFPFATTCRNYLIRLLCCFGAMASFMMSYMIPSCCPDFYDSDYNDPDCCSWAGTNYFIYIFSWILFVWYCLSGLYVVIVKKEEMTWTSSSTQQSGNYQVTTTSVTTSSNMCFNIFMLALQAGVLLTAMVILPAMLGDDCQNYYC